MNWKVWLARKLGLKGALDQEKIIEYNAIIREEKIKRAQAEREALSCKNGLVPNRCATCAYSYKPKGIENFIDLRRQGYEQSAWNAEPERETDKPHSIRYKATMRELQQQPPGTLLHHYQEEQGQQYSEN